MTTTTTMLKLSTLPSRAAYSPLIPSPLNPDVDVVAPQRHQRLREKRRLQGRGDVSPTQRLLRHKAAMAWKSEALTRESRIYTREEILSIIADCDTQDAAARTAVIMPDLKQKKQPQVHIRAAHWKETDGEEDDFFCELDDLLGVDTPDGSPRQWPTLVPKLRSPFSKDTARRVALAIGLMCICGCLPVLRAHGFHIYQGSEAP
ncbi:hypothetical protein GCG54_00001859 [Colletotrichum gloeosporioides]|uniref:Uncharacterized protein n=2 Tax=Colletotrichum gloeosporioides TaxID=474922 RepID=T0KB60_COLGC|nr:uncharacterized protein GCG54_00001859 [Colletotrichum gloeosporioides]EQB50368.1 hypothetical protein CGLO_10197 [Colletotrichum gloeosporioides Cg-14]KAF3811532.1 hypothetical protein GCG54_00001859 [Colletotrichum gloeosporioides]